jgi:hypothetical protein
MEKVFIFGLTLGYLLARMVRLYLQGEEQY